MNMQPAILPGAPRAARYLSFSLLPETDAATSMNAVAALSVDESIAVGVNCHLRQKLRTHQGLLGPDAELFGCRSSRQTCNQKNKKSGF